MVSSDQAGRGILSLVIKDKALLQAAYMPFIRNGGLFVPTSQTFALGQEVFLLLTLMGEAARIPVAGKVVWITPHGAEGQWTTGIGVQFNEPNSPLQVRIEGLLASFSGSDLGTQTL